MCYDYVSLICVAVLIVVLSVVPGVSCIILFKHKNFQTCFCEDLNVLDPVLPCLVLVHCLCFAERKQCRENYSSIHTILIQSHLQLASLVACMPNYWLPKNSTMASYNKEGMFIEAKENPSKTPWRHLLRSLVYTLIHRSKPLWAMLSGISSSAKAQWHVKQMGQQPQNDGGCPGNPTMAPIQYCCHPLFTLLKNVLAQISLLSHLCTSPIW